MAFLSVFMRTFLRIVVRVGDSRDDAYSFHTASASACVTSFLALLLALIASLAREI